RLVPERLAGLSAWMNVDSDEEGRRETARVLARYAVWLSALGDLDSAAGFVAGHAGLIEGAAGGHSADALELVARVRRAAAQQQDDSATPQKNDADAAGRDRD